MGYAPSRCSLPGFNIEVSSCSGAGAKCFAAGETAPLRGALLRFAQKILPPPPAALVPLSAVTLQAKIQHKPNRQKICEAVFAYL